VNVLSVGLNKNWNILETSQFGFGPADVLVTLRYNDAWPKRSVSCIVGSFIFNLKPA
jgi:hypothetical protein